MRQLAPYAAPKELVLLSSLPKTSIGKAPTPGAASGAIAPGRLGASWTHVGCYWFAARSLGLARGAAAGAAAGTRTVSRLPVAPPHDVQDRVRLRRQAGHQVAQPFGAVQDRHVGLAELAGGSARISGMFSTSMRSSTTPPRGRRRLGLEADGVRLGAGPACGPFRLPPRPGGPPRRRVAGGAAQPGTGPPWPVRPSTSCSALAWASGPAWAAVCWAWSIWAWYSRLGDRCLLLVLGLVAVRLLADFRRPLGLPAPGLFGRPGSRLRYEAATAPLCSRPGRRPSTRSGKRRRRGPISPFPASTRRGLPTASFWRSRMMSSTVIEPTTERR